MKTGTVAILASCLLGQALAAPLKDKLSEIPVKVDGETKDIKIDDLKDALKDLVTNAPEALNVGTPAKRGDDKVKEVLGALGLKKDDLDKKVLKKVQDKVEGLTDTAASPISRFSDIGGLLEILKPLLEQAGGITGGATGGATDAATGAASGVAGAAPKKRTTDPLNTILGNLGIDAKDLDKKTLKKVEKKVEEIADQSATPISRAAGLGSLLDILKPLLAGAEEQVGSATDSAKGLTDTATNLAGSATKGLPVGGTPAKRDADQNALKQLLQALGLDGALDSVTSTAGSALGGAGSPAMKRGLLDGLLGGGDKDSPLKGVTDTVGGAVDSVGKTADGLTGGLTAPVTGAAGQAVDAAGGAASGATGLGKRGQFEALLDLLLGGDKKGNNPLKGVTKPVGGAVDAVGKTTGGLTRRQLDGLLDGLLGGGKGDNPLKGLTDTVGGTVDSVGKTADGLTGGLTAPVTGAAGQAVDAAGGAASGATGLGKRQGLDIAALLQALGPVLGQLKDNADSSSGKAPKTPAASTPTPPPAAPAPPAPAPPAAPKVKRQELPIDPAAADPAAAAEPAPAPADITPAALPEPEDEEPLSVIFDDLSEVSSLLGEVEGAVPAEQVDTLRETIDAFLSSISNFLPEGAAPDSSPVAPAPEEAAPTPIP